MAQKHLEVLVITAHLRSLSLQMWFRWLFGKREHAVPLMLLLDSAPAAATEALLGLGQWMLPCFLESAVAKSPGKRTRDKYAYLQSSIANNSNIL